MHKATKETATVIILQPLSCMLIVTINICEEITCSYKNMKVATLKVHFLTDVLKVVVVI